MTSIEDTREKISKGILYMFLKKKIIMQCREIKAKNYNKKKLS